MAGPVDEEKVREALMTVKDPELGFDIVNLGLVYGLDIHEGKVYVKMTLTTPACAAGPFIVEQVKEAVRRVPGVEDVDVELVWQPRWTEDMMSEELKEILRWGMYR